MFGITMLQHGVPKDLGSTLMVRSFIQARVHTAKMVQLDFGQLAVKQREATTTLVRRVLQA